MSNLPSRRLGCALTLCALLSGLGLPTSAAAGRESGEGVPYRLDGPSVYLSGCIDGLCLCPIRVEYLAGTFDLTAAGTSGEFEVYSVGGIDWFTSAYGDAGRRVTGSGTYFLGDETQQLVLELLVDEAETISVDSGVVPRAATFPAIDVGALTGGICYQEGVDIEAAPTAVGLRLSMALPEMITWSVVPAAASYDLVAGDLRQLRATGGDFTTSTTACIADDVVAPSMGVADPVGSGTATWFLVRGNPQPGFDSAGYGQVDARDAEIEAAPGSCP